MNELYCNTTDHIRYESCGEEVTPWFQITLTILCALSISVGITGNSVVLAAVFLVPKLRTYSNVFLTSLAVADLGAMLTGSTTLLLGLYGHEVMWDNPWLCQVLLNFTFLFIFTSITTLQVIAMDRYLIITRLRGVYNLYYRRWRIWAVVGGTWLVGLVMTQFSLFSTFICGDAYAESLHICYIDIANPVSMACVTSALFLSCVLCMFTIPLCFALTFRKIRTARKRSRGVGVGAVTAASGNRVTKAMAAFSKEELIVTRMMAIVYVTFVVCWTPMLFTHLSYFGGRLCPGYAAHYIFALLALFNSSINPLIYAGVNKSFRHSFLDVLKRQTRKESVAEVTISMNMI